MERVPAAHSSDKTGTRQRICTAVYEGDLMPPFRVSPLTQQQLPPRADFPFSNRWSLVCLRAADDKTRMSNPTQNA